MELRHVSASSINKFIACPASWLVGYDEDTRVKARTEYTDAGTLVHGALERFHAPTYPGERTLENLVNCYKAFCAEQALAESLDVYKRGLKLCKKMYELETEHPTLPMHLLQTTNVELRFDDFQLPGWPLPVKGFIDRVAVIIDPNDTHELALVIKDYKTGQTKNHEQLVGEDVQPVLYLLYALHVLQPQIEQQGFTVRKVQLVWDYIDHGESVSLDKDDFEDLDATTEYLGNIMRQMQSLVAEWNQNAEAGKPKARVDFLPPFEKQNPYCSWCTRKKECQTFNKLLELGQVVNLTDPELSWDDFMRERARLQLAYNEFKKRLDEASDIFKLYLQQENKDYIIANGRLWKADMVNRVTYPLDELSDILGADFVFNAGEVTKKSIDAELARLKESEPARYKQVKAQIDELGKKNTRPGYRRISDSLIPRSKEKA